MNQFAITALLVVCTFLSGPLFAQGEQDQGAPSDWAAQGVTWHQAGETVKVGSVAAIQLPTGYLAATGSSVQAILKLTGNLPDPSCLALLTGAENPLEWFALFSWEDIGYVKDDEVIDADALMASMKEAQQQSNEERKKRGLGSLNLIGWGRTPAYDQVTRNLEWSTRLQFDQSQDISLNYFSKSLARRGVMTSNLICDPSAIDRCLPEFRAAMANFRFLEGESYAEYREGDRVAEYGLAGLIAGGAIFGAAKLGLLQKFWKLILGAIVVIGGVFAKLFKRGGNSAAPRRGHRVQRPTTPADGQ